MAKVTCAKLPTLKEAYTNTAKLSHSQLLRVRLLGVAVTEVNEVLCAQYRLYRDKYYFIGMQPISHERKHRK